MTYEPIKLPTREEQIKLDTCHQIIKDLEAEYNAQFSNLRNLPEGLCLVQDKSSRNRKIRIALMIDHDRWQLYFECPWEIRLQYADAIIALEPQ